MTIGSFGSYSNTTFDSLNNAGNYSFNSNFLTAYYYLDDVSLTQCSIDSDVPVDIEISNVFSPNGDGINDYFEIRGLNVEDKIDIYNRWGTLIFSFKGNEKWNGKTNKNQDCSDGTYFYLIQSSKTELKRGFVSLFK
jgi:gliding motility-associated-like protein